MPNQSCSRIALAVSAVLLFAGQFARAADRFPDYVSTQYQRYFARFVDDRTLPEQMLNAVHMTSREYGRGFALIAGISKYPSIGGAAGDLAPAGEDVRKLVNYLTTYEKFDEIVVLKDADVTEANLSFFLQRYFPRRLQQFPHSRFLFAYSGHGATVNGKGYILTAEAHDFTDTFNSIPMATLRAMFQQVVDSGFHVLALINACYSGDFLKRSFGDARFIPKYPGAHAITAGGSSERTWHDPTVGSGSLFFEKLYPALDGRIGRDGIVTVDDLAAYLRREVQISTEQTQNPLPGDLSRDGSLGGFFFFNRRPLVEKSVLPAWDAARGLPFGIEPRVDTAVTGPVGNGLQAARKSEAYALLNNRDFDRAIDSYNEVLRFDPTDADALTNRGFAKAQKKDYDRAIADYSEAIRLDSKLAYPYYGRGNAYRDKGDLDRAISDQTEAIRLDPTYSYAFISRADVYYRKHEYDRAIADYSEAIRLDSKHAYSYFGRGNAYRDKADLDRAISDQTEAIRLDPTYSYAFIARGGVYYRKQKYDSAIADFTEAIRIDPENTAAFQERGDVYRDLARIDLAVMDYAKAASLRERSESVQERSR